jgi:hypothetical protein
MKPPGTPIVETAVEPAWGAIVVTEVEAKEVHEPSAGPEQPEEDQD